MFSFLKKRAKSKINFPSEFRRDLESNDWVLIATGRAKRPKDFKKERIKRDFGSKKSCFFCNIKTQALPVLVYSGKKLIEPKSWQEVPKNWSVLSIPNKYPAVLPYHNLSKKIEGGLYEKINAAGFHEVVVTRDHKKQLAQFSLHKLKEVFDVYQARYLKLKKENFVNHISIFHNHGPSAGASVVHPHSQILTTPLVDIDLSSALLKAKEYYKKNKKCIYCQMINWEIKNKKRIVFENKKFLVLCPFASKTAFEIIVTPKKHLSYFENISESEKKDFCQAFHKGLSKIYKGLKDPDYNFYLHTAPSDGKNYDYYHWHWTILPRTSVQAGFELGARMEISTIEPEKAASYLRKQ